ncbi:MAG: hypothetical protein JJ958_06665 [Balneola sp.]|nr:hypothetical protein [Balneola sp.]
MNPATQIIKLTAVTNNGLIANPELVSGNFNEVCKGLADEVKKTNEFNFIVISKVAKPQLRRAS